MGRYSWNLDHNNQLTNVFAGMLNTTVRRHHQNPKFHNQTNIEVRESSYHNTSSIKLHVLNCIYPKLSGITARTRCAAAL
jgi:hypothetical protein